MPQPQLSDALAQQALDLAEEYGSGYLAAKALGKDAPPAKTLNSRIATARLRGMKPTIRKDAPRVYTRQRLGKVHLVIPDTQVKPGVNTDHFEWAGNFVVEKKPDVIVHIGDHWDMPSLSMYDKGKLPFEGRRYVKDVEAGRAAMRKLLDPIDNYNRTATEKYKPRLVFCHGNHEHRIVRVSDNNPEFDGKFSLDDLGLDDFGWEVHPFQKIVKIDGIEYAHLFTSGVMGRPCSSAAVVLRERQCSATMGHVQTYDQAIHKKTQQRAMFCGTFYSHDEEFLGHQGNCQRRHLIVKHEVDEGRYDLMEVSLAFLSKAYS